MSHDSIHVFGNQISHVVGIKVKEFLRKKITADKFNITVNLQKLAKIKIENSLTFLEEYV